jgi:hypothetical protein
VTDATVAIAEIAAAMGRRHAEVERKAAELGMLVKSDWQGRPALPVADARGWRPVRPVETSNMTGPGAASARHERSVEGRSRAIADAARTVRRRREPSGS